MPSCPPLPELSPPPPSPVVLDQKMRALFALIERIGHSLIPVLLIGETGSGKEVVAEWVHRSSPRAARPLLRINCAGLTESVVESELFGHERGAFTGAAQAHAGLFEAADGGTLLLDELGELPLRTQAKLLRVLESGELTRIGSTRPRLVSVRFIAATHRPLPELVAAGVFRRDLYYRLNGAQLEIPPLRERRSEILPLARHFLQRIAERGPARPARLSLRAEQALLEHHWPGNVRELKNVIEYAAALCREAVIERELLELGSAGECGLDPAPQRAGAPGERDSARRQLRDEIKRFERQCIESALERCSGNQTRAARELGISRRALTSKLTEHGLARPRKRATCGEPQELYPSVQAAEERVG